MMASVFYRFRWVVLSLDYFCGLDNVKLIEKRLGKLPPKLGELYDKMYVLRQDGSTWRRGTKNQLKCPKVVTLWSEVA